MKTAIVGGGVSGVITAIYAARNNKDVVILERNDKLLKKLLLTGNGRCNYFNDDQNISHYHSSIPSLLNNIIKEENINELLSFYNKLGIIPKIRDGYYYPYSNQASSVRNILLKELEHLNIEVKLNYLVEDIKIDNGFIINNELKVDKLVLSAGSKAYPKTGSDGMGYNFLKNFNHNIVSVKPALVQLKSNNPYLKEIDGVRSDVKVSLYEDTNLLKEQTGELQFTDYGISGICTMNLSHLIDNNNYVLINFVNNIDIENIIDEVNSNAPYRTIIELLEGIINYKIIRVILKKCNINIDLKWNDLNSNQKNIFIDNLKQFRLDIIGTNDFDRSQVCSGGLSLDEIDLNTMESKKIKNLYIVGELLDIDGDCGGYNLTVAFITGYLAGVSI